MACPNGCGHLIIADQLPQHRGTCCLEMVDCPWKDVTGCEYHCVRSNMTEHSDDTLNHFTGNIAIKLLARVTALEVEVETLKYDKDRINKESIKLRKELNVLKAECSQVTFAWHIANYDLELAPYDSPDFQAFGHTLKLQFNRCGDGSSALSLFMRSQVPCKLGCVLTIGRYDEFVGSVHVQKLMISPTTEFPLNGDWDTGNGIEVLNSELIPTKLLTLDGTLQMKVVLYKSTPNENNEEDEGNGSSNEGNGSSNDSDDDI
jgi:hypothetical protein